MIEIILHCERCGRVQTLEAPSISTMRGMVGEYYGEVFIGIDNVLLCHSCEKAFQEHSHHADTAHQNTLNSFIRTFKK